MKNKEIVRQLRKKAKQHKGITFLSIENGMYEKFVDLSSALANNI